MELDTIIENFFRKIFNLELVRRSINLTSKKEFERLITLKKHFEESSEIQKGSSSIHAMCYDDATSGMKIPFGFSEISIDEHIARLMVRKNREYCWLLAEAYEEFENFLEFTYAYIGKKDSSNWVKNDFGDTPLSDVIAKDYCWYLDKIKKRKDVLKHVLNRLGLLCPSLKFIEKNNKFNIDLRLVIVLIEKFRHLIVHQSGKTTDKELFIKTVLSDLGIWNNGKYLPEYREFIDQFFGKGDYENTIMLLEIEVKPGKSFEFYIDTYDTIIGFLLSYSAMIYQCISGKQLELKDLKPLQ